MYPFSFMVAAVDFDGTLHDGKAPHFPQIGSPKQKVIDKVLSLKRSGWKLILWTCRTDQDLLDAIEWCSVHGIVFDEVNKNLKEVIEYWGGRTGPKISADLYIDDKAVHPDDFVSIRARRGYRRGWRAIRKAS